MLGIPCSVLAQTLSIQELHQRADQSVSYRLQALQAKVAVANYEEEKLNRLPVFFIDGNIQRNLIIPTTPVPAIAFDPTAPAGAIVPLKFATKWSSKLGLQFEWNLFDPARKYKEASQNAQIERANLQLEEAKADWIDRATLAYAAVVLATKQYAFSIEDSTTYAEILRRVEFRVQEGRERHELLIQSQQEMERKRIQVREAWSVLVEADLELSMYVDLSSTKELTSDISEIVQQLTGKQEKNYEFLLTQIDLKESEFDYRAIRRQYLPSLSMNAYIGEQYFSNQLSLAQPDQWYGNSFVNLSIKVPISSYFVLPKSLKKSRYFLEQNQIKLEDLATNELIKNKQLDARMAAAEEKIAAFKRIEALAKQLVDDKEAGYEAGRILLSDFQIARSAWFKAKQDVWQAEYDLINLLITYKKTS